MKQEDKELLLKDLCARLPYGVKVQDELGRINKLVIGNSDLVRLYYNDFSTYSEEKLSLPLLFPLSSMTEEQLLELTSISFENSIDSSIKTLDYCYRNHYDVNNLIPMGLAIDATGLDILNFLKYDTRRNHKTHQ